MNVVLDTNIFRSDILMKSNKFEILFDYLKKTNSKIILPKIVYEELGALYEREVKNRLSQYLNARKTLAAALVSISLPEINLSIRNEVENYLSYLKERLGITDKDIFEYRDSYLKEVIARAIYRKRPCTERGEEIRDAILWQSVVDIAQQSNDKSIVFISNNTDQFAAKDKTLHADLNDEAKDKNIQLIYFSSLEIFIQKQASRIDFITCEWLEASLDSDQLIERARESFGDTGIHPVPCNEGQTFTGHFHITTLSLGLRSFYVYEMTDGSYRVEATFRGEAEAECEIEEIVKKEEWDYNYDYDILGTLDLHLIPRKTTDIKTFDKYTYTEFKMELDVKVQDKSIVGWDVIHFDLV